MGGNFSAEGSPAKQGGRGGVGARGTSLGMQTMPRHNKGYFLSQPQSQAAPACTPLDKPREH